MGIVLITGGSRSGKSAYAEARLRRFDGPPTLIATAEARDEDMRARIAAHNERRGADWTVIEEPLDLVRALARTDGKGPRLVDCLAGWLSNVMLDRRDWFEGVRELELALERQQSPLVLVTQEVGGSVVPGGALTRRYQEAVGLMNQAVAEIADEVVLVVAGQALRIKPPAS